ncbi:MAG TPA: hypothetical protein VL087_03875 [Nitrospirota bacterium]|nr:hypothetical protein [Nitrospirota bacterium]
MWISLSAFARLLASADQTLHCSAGGRFASAFGQEKVCTLHVSIEFEAARPYFCIILEKGAFGLVDSPGNDDAMLSGDHFPREVKSGREPDLSSNEGSQRVMNNDRRDTIPADQFNSG